MNYVNVPRVCWGLKFDTQTEGLGVYLIDSYRFLGFLMTFFIWGSQLRDPGTQKLAIIFNHLKPIMMP